MGNKIYILLLFVSLNGIYRANTFERTDNDDDNKLVKKELDNSEDFRGKLPSEELLKEDSDESSIAVGGQKIKGIDEDEEGEEGQPAADGDETAKKDEEGERYQEIEDIEDEENNDLLDDDDENDDDENDEDDKNQEDVVSGVMKAIRGAFEQVATVGGKADGNEQGNSAPIDIVDVTAVGSTDGNADNQESRAGINDDNGDGEDVPDAANDPDSVNDDEDDYSDYDSDDKDVSDNIPDDDQDGDANDNTGSDVVTPLIDATSDDLKADKKIRFTAEDSIRAGLDSLDWYVHLGKYNRDEALVNDDLTKAQDTQNNKETLDVEENEIGEGKVNSERHDAAVARRRIFTTRRRIVTSRRRRPSTRRRVVTSRRRSITTRRRVTASRRRHLNTRRRVATSRRRHLTTRRRVVTSRRRAMNLRIQIRFIVPKRDVPTANITTTNKVSPTS